jgi:hypothetical protein
MREKEDREINEKQKRDTHLVEENERTKGIDGHTQTKQPATTTHRNAPCTHLFFYHFVPTTTVMHHHQPSRAYHHSTLFLFTTLCNGVSPNLSAASA